MDFSRHHRRPLREPILPMINVVFLLLIFFLMTARITPSDPYDLSLPEVATVQPTDSERTLFVSPQGDVAMGALKGDAVWQALAASPKRQRLVIEADAQMPATALSQTIARLAGLGITQIAIGAVPQ